MTVTHLDMCFLGRQQNSGERLLSVDEAIFFDIYCFVKFAVDGVRDERPVLNEGTPIFRNMHFDNMVCSGAKKGIFIVVCPR